MTGKALHQATELGRQAHRRRCARRKAALKNVGVATALMWLKQQNEVERQANENFEHDLPFGTSFNVALHIIAGADASTLLVHGYSEEFLQAIMGLPGFTIAAAISEPVLRSYLRHLLIEIFNWRDEIDAMIDCLVEMYRRRREIPSELTTAYLESWWEDCLPVALKSESMPSA